MPARRAFAIALVLGVSVLAAAPGRADVLPPPTRPSWDEHPPPLPDPPPEKDLERAALAALTALTLAGAGLLGRRRALAEPRS